MPASVSTSSNKAGNLPSRSRISDRARLMRGTSPPGTPALALAERWSGSSNSPDTTEVTGTTQAAETEGPLRLWWWIRASWWPGGIPVPPINRRTRINRTNRRASPPGVTPAMSRDDCDGHGRPKPSHDHRRRYGQSAGVPDGGGTVEVATHNAFFRLFNRPQSQQRGGYGLHGGKRLL